MISKNRIKPNDSTNTRSTLLIAISILEPFSDFLNKKKFGMILGAIISPIIMGIIFFLVVTPTGLILRIMGKDLLNKKYDKKKKSYWIKRDKYSSTMKQQF